MKKVKGLKLRALYVNNDNNNSNANSNNNLNNNARFLRISQTLLGRPSLWEQLCSYENLELAFLKARKRKTLKPYVIEFEHHLKKKFITTSF
jgi:very-short-patch-repair endonuclease